MWVVFFSGKVMQYRKEALSEKCIKSAQTFAKPVRSRNNPSALARFAILKLNNA